MPSKVDQILAWVSTLSEQEEHQLESELRYRRNATTRLLKLPPELRNRIYFYIAVQGVKAHVEEQTEPALLRASRQLRAEFHGLYYSNVVMQMERHRYIQGKSVWEPMADFAFLKALLSVPPVQRGKALMQRVGGLKIWIWKVDPSVSPGDVEAARSKTEMDMSNFGLLWSLIAVLVPPSESKVGPYVLLQI